MQHGYKLEMGRKGVMLEIFRLGERAQTEYTWDCAFNSKGISVSRGGEGEDRTQLCDFDTFLFPDQVEDDELKLVEVLSGVPLKEDLPILRLCSFLVAKWAAGHDEESFHKVISKTISKFSEL